MHIVQNTEIKPDMTSCLMFLKEVEILVKSGSEDFKICNLRHATSTNSAGFRDKCYSC